MSIKVGQIRQDCKGMYVISKIGKCAFGDYVDIIYSDGSTYSTSDENICNVRMDEIVAEYDGWLTALNSKEFKNNECNF